MQQMQQPAPVALMMTHEPAKDTKTEGVSYPKARTDITTFNTSSKHPNTAAPHSPSEPDCNDGHDGHNLTPPGGACDQESRTIKNGSDEVTEQIENDGLLRTAISPDTTLKYELQSHLENGSGFEQPAASSLVSPPASSHDEAEQLLSNLDPNLAPSASSSRHSSQHPKQTQRYTPESGPIRRDSSSSTNPPPHVGTPSRAASPPTIGRAPDSAQKRVKAPPGFETVTDEESLRLIKELQAEEYGLRRRGRV